LRRLTRSLVQVDYYVGIGQNAYAQLSRSLDSRAGSTRTIADVYAELADQFPRFVDVLGEVRKRIALAEVNATTDVTKLYEIWLRSRDEWVEKKLRALGVLVDPSGSIQ
jgi:hypothetical protein